LIPVNTSPVKLGEEIPLIQTANSGTIESTPKPIQSTNGSNTAAPVVTGEEILQPTQSGNSVTSSNTLEQAKPSSNNPATEFVVSGGSRRSRKGRRSRKSVRKGSRKRSRRSRRV
jgi:hypothetical protein